MPKRNRANSKSVEVRIERSSGNVFEDLDLPDASEHFAKAQLAAQICSILWKRKLTQACAADILRVDQPKVSALLRGKLDGFSMERLIHFLNALGRDVDIRIGRARSQPARTRVLIA